MWRIGPGSCLLLVVTGCSSAPEGQPPGATRGDAAPYAGCSPSSFSLPLTRSGKAGRLAASVVDAAPAQPAKDDNVWTLRVEGAEVASAETYMAVHDHFGVPAPTVEPAGASEFRLDLYFMMRGPWEVRVNLVSAEAGSDQVVFDVCVTE